MDVDWGSLGEVVVISLAVTVVVVVVFSLGVAAWARGGEGEAHPATPRSTARRTAFGAAALCFAACLAVAAYGIHLIVSG